MPDEYCEKHEWPAGMGTPCPDCTELAALQAEIERLKAQVDYCRCCSHPLVCPLRYEDVSIQRDAALLQLGEVPKKLLEAVNAEQLRCGKIAEAFWNEDDKLNADLRVKLTQAEKSMAYMISTNIRAMRWREENFTEKPKDVWTKEEVDSLYKDAEKLADQLDLPKPEKRICLCPSSGGAVGAICFVCNGTRQ